MLVKFFQTLRDAYVAGVPSRNRMDCWVKKGKIPDDDDMGAGKWILEFDRVDVDLFLTPLDRAWASIVKLVKGKALIGASCSTARDTENASNSRMGVINCYTSDYRDAVGVRRAAEQIRKALDYDGTFFYEANVDQKRGEFQQGACSGGPLYGYTEDYELRVRDEHGKWHNIHSGETIVDIIPERSRMLRNDVIRFRRIMHKRQVIMTFKIAAVTILAACLLFIIYLIYSAS